MMGAKTIRLGVFGVSPQDNSTASPEDRRRHKRTNILLKVRYAAARDFLADYTENISHGGVFIATEEKFQRGEEVEFEVSFPGLLEPIRLEGKVKWLRPAAGDSPSGVGLEFEGDAPVARPLSVLVSRLDAGEPPVVVKAGGKHEFCVLLVEDNLVVRDMFRYGIQKMIRSRGDEKLQLVVREAGNGQEAWDQLQAGAFNLVVLDLYMPVMDGTQLIEKMKQEHRTRNIPIVVVSSGGEEDRRRALQAGADLYLPKPIKLRDLLDTIGKLVPATS